MASQSLFAVVKEWFHVLWHRKEIIAAYEAENQALEASVNSLQGHIGLLSDDLREAGAKVEELTAKLAAVEPQSEGLLKNDTGVYPEGDTTTFTVRRKSFGELIRDQEVRHNPKLQEALAERKKRRAAFSR